MHALLPPLSPFIVFGFHHAAAPHRTMHIAYVLHPPDLLPSPRPLLLSTIPQSATTATATATAATVTATIVSTTAAKMDIDKRFSTKDQKLHRLQEGISFGDGGEYNPEEYQRHASKFAKEYKNRFYPDLRFTPENLERDYWDIVETRNREVSVEYGNDVDTDKFGSGFPQSQRGRSVLGKKDEEKAKLPEPKFGSEEYYKETWWNLNNMPWAPDSVLRNVKVGINGINVPWMYYGSLFTTFCWHNEDNYLYSINYHHKGAPKQWYGVSGSKKDADGLEKVFKNYLSMKMRDVPDLLHHITTMFSPRLLQNAHVPVYKLLQYPGEYVVTFPRSFHGGFSLGPNIGEAVNFATHDWIALGAEANERYRSFARPAVFSHDRLTFTMTEHLDEQKAYATCKLLLNEVERVVKEEMDLRNKLIKDGVRDVSDVISLPPNRLDQLDEESANYDDKRLCHACKHVCFFSAVACECSQSKVSCLRHSHYMCRCPTERKYLMIWSTKKEMSATLDRVRNKCEELRKNDAAGAAKPNIDQIASPAPIEFHEAVGVQEDLLRHKDKDIPLDPYEPINEPPRSVPSSPVPDLVSASPGSVSEESKEYSVDTEDDEDCEVQIIDVQRMPSLQ